MRVVFFGSSTFSLPSLDALASSDRHCLVGVVTQPDRPSGRNRHVVPGVVHAAAARRGFDLMMPEKVGSPESLAMLCEWRPDLIAVASYGQYIPSLVLDIPPRRVVNVHPSLLPKYRGAAPLQWSIAQGETISGITLFYVVKEMDAGDIILQEESPILPDENARQLGDRFAEQGAKLLLCALDQIEDGTVRPVPQDPGAVTYAPKLTKEDGRLDWSLPARQLHNRIRGFQPWPGAYFHARGLTVKVWRSAMEAGYGHPGEILGTDGNGPLIATGEGALRLLEVQPEGKRSMTGQAFLCGHPWKPGQLL